MLSTFFLFEVIILTNRDPFYNSFLFLYNNHNFLITVSYPIFKYSNQPINPK
jgi:hypothetical protein